MRMFVVLSLTAALVAGCAGRRPGAAVPDPDEPLIKSGPWIEPSSTQPSRYERPFEWRQWEQRRVIHQGPPGTFTVDAVVNLHRLPADGELEVVLAQGDRTLQTATLRCRDDGWLRCEAVFDVPGP